MDTQPQHTSENPTAGFKQGLQYLTAAIACLHESLTMLPEAMERGELDEQEAREEITAALQNLRHNLDLLGITIPVAERIEMAVELREMSRRLMARGNRPVKIYRMTNGGAPQVAKPAAPEPVENPITAGKFGDWQPDDVGPEWDDSLAPPDVNPAENGCMACGDVGPCDACGKDGSECVDSAE